MLAALVEKRLLVPALAALAGFAVLVSLGLWQLERRTWKEGLLAAIALRASAAPVPLAQASERLRAGGDVEYLRVRLEGRFLHDKERYLYAPDQVLGPGYHVYTPFETADGTVLFVNRGFVPEALRDPQSRAAGQQEGEVELTGLVRLPGTKGFFTPENEPLGNLWYWRDFTGLFRSAFGDAEPPRTPLFVDAETPAPGGWPKGGATRLELPNRHLEYAITWFGLAAALAAVFAVFAAGRLRS